MNNKIYLALDFPTWKEAERFLQVHQLEHIPVKVGMELFYREGPALIEKLKEKGHPIFLDLKLHDIPTTVMRAMVNLASMEVDIVNVHATGGSEMIKRAKEGLIKGSSSSPNTKLIAVTVLTSMDKAVMNKELRLSGEVEEQVVRLATLSKESGADGVVCSVHEANAIKTACGSSFLTVTPGIRLEDSKQNDQKRIATPHFAKINGADILVVGRSITKAINPRQAYDQIIKEFEHGSK
ncbi:orotidine-5'-phosphate decarboxylase [Virgibacillus halodenitrificans]|jgi:orotidine-5'-phosphate decarboxylase|uniref:orotidine-5'-phosphate decarboxylase n=1 Tax=Virgibacillus halodenitrificans TaxID=1482 RepID=UPI000EF4AE06|nr:orotidine-5'-phosphate decarboxylase [Virgibacillus halodenitrificans]MCJ0931269.1 orotidine-5'-phosphate decarboxylase [Virgibacillus halodenitrificans]